MEVMMMILVCSKLGETNDPAALREQILLQYAGIGEAYGQSADPTSWKSINGLGRCQTLGRDDDKARCEEAKNKAAIFGGLRPINAASVLIGSV
jgi:hypothetical protein